LKIFKFINASVFHSFTKTKTEKKKENMTDIIPFTPREFQVQTEKAVARILGFATGSLVEWSKERDERNRKTMQEMKDVIIETIQTNALVDVDPFIPYLFHCVDTRKSVSAFQFVTVLDNARFVVVSASILRHIMTKVKQSPNVSVADLTRLLKKLFPACSKFDYKHIHTYLQHTTFKPYNDKKRVGGIGNAENYCVISINTWMKVYNQFGRSSRSPEISETIGDPKMLTEDNTWGEQLPEDQLEKFSWMHGDPPSSSLQVMGNGWKNPAKRAKKSASK
jgi:hypothetical protein